MCLFLSFSLSRFRCIVAFHSAFISFNVQYRNIIIIIIPLLWFLFFSFLSLSFFFSYLFLLLLLLFVCECVYLRAMAMHWLHSDQMNDDFGI